MRPVDTQYDDDPVARAAADAPVDGEPVTEEERRLILKGKAALARGERGTSMEEVLAEFGLTMDDFPLKRRA